MRMALFISSGVYRVVTNKRMVLLLHPWVKDWLRMLMLPFLLPLLGRGCWAWILTCRYTASALFLLRFLWCRHQQQEPRLFELQRIQRSKTVIVKGWFSLSESGVFTSAEEVIDPKWLYGFDELCGSTLSSSFNRDSLAFFLFGSICPVHKLKLPPSP
jgi:hypothetical protein